VANPTVSPEAYTTYGMLSKYDWSPRFKAALMGSIEVESLDPKTKNLLNTLENKKVVELDMGCFNLKEDILTKRLEFTIKVS